jgi:hypothetical protein
VTWLEGWQGGLVLGAALTIAINAIVRALLFRKRHRDHSHCGLCDGCLGEEGRAIAAVETLVICPKCGDTFPRQHAPEQLIRYNDEVQGVVAEIAVLGEMSFCDSCGEPCGADDNSLCRACCPVVQDEDR